MEFESPMSINSSANVMEIVEGKSSNMAFTAGLALTMTVCAEAGTESKGIANSPMTPNRFRYLIIRVYPRLTSLITRGAITLSHTGLFDTRFLRRANRG